MNDALFKNPGVENRIMPFWFWNGELSDEQISFQIREMAEKGVGGFFVHARQGMDIPYLSDAWFEKVEYAVKQAEQYGLKVWLYDEFPYPSGIAGGEVILQHRDAKQCSLVYKTAVVEGPQQLTLELPFARTLSAVAVPKDETSGTYIFSKKLDIKNFIGNRQRDHIYQESGLTSYSYKRYFTNTPIKRLTWKVPEGTWKVYIFLEEEINEFKFYGTFIDPCHEEAMKTFINLTHERYAKRLGRYFGNTIRGMFTDETGFLGLIPWSPHIVEYFKELYGYDILDHMIAFADSGYDNGAKIRCQYIQALHRLFLSTYHRQNSEWCDRHGLKYIAEAPSVRSTTQLYCHIPGGDSAHEKLGKSLEWIIERYTGILRNNPKNVSSIARQLGRKYTLIECFHSVGWSMTLQDAKWMIDRMAAMGINMFNFHAFFYTLNGLRKHDAPPSQFYQNPYWKHFKLLGDYSARISYIMSEGKSIIDIAVLDPVTTLWSHMGSPFRNLSYGGSDPVEKEKYETLKQDWIDICGTLLAGQHDYDHLDAEILVDANVENGRITIGNASYSVLVLPPISNLEEKAWEKIKAFVEGGGKVMGVGLLPCQSINDNPSVENEILDWFGLDTKPQLVYWGKDNPEGREEITNKAHGKGFAYFLPCSGGFKKGGYNKEFIKIINKISPSMVKIHPASAKKETFLVQTRKMSDGSHTIFVSNQEDGDGNVDINISIDCDNLVFEKLDLETGDSLPIEAKRIDSGWSVTLRFYPYEAHLLRIRAYEGTDDRICRTGELPVLKLDAAQSWRVKTLEHNVLRLEKFHFSLDLLNEGLDKNWHKEAPIPGWPQVVAKTIISQCEDLKDRSEYKLKFTQDFGTPVKLSLAYPVTGWYKTTFLIDTIPKEAKLLMDKAAISGKYSIYINGNALNLCEFKQVFRYDHNNVECNIQPLLKTGINHIAIRVECSHDWDGLTDPLYITGTFGLTFHKESMPVIGTEPLDSSLTEVIYEGLPYYSGTISFKNDFVLNSIFSSSKFEIGFDNWSADFHDCAEVLVNGHSLGVRAWIPYKWTGNTEILKQGLNDVEVRITNTLANMIEGRYFDYNNHMMKNIK